jgi:glycosyltransferase involved in cell wall biosynthesis
MTTPLFSIITVNYNNKVGLLNTIKSVFNQSCTDFEFIIIDGGSTDGSKEIIESYQNRLAYCVSEKDAGIYDAMNKGIKKASGTYLYFLNSGDVFASDDVLGKISLTANENSYDFIYGNIILNGKLVKYNSKISLHYILDMGISHQAQFLHKKLFELEGLYNLEYKVTADSAHLLLCFLKHQTSYSHINIPIAVIEPNGLSEQSRSSNRLERKRFMENEMSFIKEDYERLMQYQRRDYIQRGINFIKRLFNK